MCIRDRHTGFRKRQAVSLIFRRLYIDVGYFHVWIGVFLRPQQCKACLLYTSHLADSLGRTWQCGTIQLDSQLPERFELEYTGEDGQKHRPVMIHRVVLGSIERFIGVITEHFAGAFPTWLSPVQVKLLPITDRAAAYADQVAAALDAAGFRVETDHRNEKIGKKIREAQLEKVPYMLVVGDKEAEDGTVSVRHRAEGDLGVMSQADFIAMLRDVVDSKARK